MREIFISASLHIHIRTKFPPCFCPFVSLVFCSLFSLPLFYFLSFQTPSLSDPHPLFLSFPSNFFHFHFPSQFPQTLHNSPANCFFFFFFSLSYKTLKPHSPDSARSILNRALDVGSSSSEPVSAATDGSDHAAAAEEAASVLVFEAAVRCSS